MAKKRKGARKASADGTKLVAANRRARFHYHLDDKQEAGLVLTGTEVKAAREGGVNLTDSYVRIKNGEAFLVGCHFSPYSSASQAANHEPVRDRKLLLHRRELDKLDAALREKGQTLLVTRLYFREGRLKAEVCVGRGKKDHDKRAAIKERAVKKEMDRAMKTYR